MAAAGICGSDLHLIEWGPMPVTLGHEIAGWLDDGTPVAIEPVVHRCGTCESCLAGDTHLCREAQTVGIGVDGGMADELVVLARLRGAAARRPRRRGRLAGRARGVRRHGRCTGPGSRPATGSRSSAGERSASPRWPPPSHLGCEVGVAARHPHQVAAAEAVGGRPVEGHYDVVIEAAGTASAFNQAIGLARVRGTIALLGTYWAEVALAATPIGLKELDVVGCLAYGHHGGHREVDDAAALLAAVPELAPALITHRFPLDDAPEAFRVAADRVGRRHQGHPRAVAPFPPSARASSSVCRASAHLGRGRGRRRGRPRR